MYDLFYHIVDDIQQLGTLFVLDRSSYEQFNVLVKQAYKRTLRRKRTRMMETVGVMEKMHGKAPSDEKKKDDGKLGRSDERLERVENNRPYVVRDVITITMEEMVRAADVGVLRSLTASFASELVNFFEVTTTKMILALLSEIDAR